MKVSAYKKLQSDFKVIALSHQAGSFDEKIYNDTSVSWAFVNRHLFDLL